jgi:hypothetical protein
VTDEPITIIDPDGPNDDVEPIAFRINHRDPAGGRADSDFHAIARIPYLWAAELLASGMYAPSVQTDALLAFFRRVIVDEDRDAFFKLLDDPQVLIQAKTLQSTAEVLLDHYLGVDPTKARRSAGPRKSQSGRSKTGRGSPATSRAKARTSR